jgi:hypothetical protein
MGDFLLVSPDGTRCVELIYDGEPPQDVYDFDFSWPTVSGKGAKYQGSDYTFDGHEQWIQL